MKSNHMIRLLVLIFSVAMLVACASMDAGNGAAPLPLADQLEYPSTMRLRYTINDNVYDVSLTPGIMSWCVEYDDGTGVCMEADRVHLLDSSLEHIPTIMKSHDLYELMIDFDVPPEYYIVHRWSDEYVGKVDEYWDAFEIVDVLDDIISLSDIDIENGWVYQLVASWPQGTADYVFYIKN